MGNAGEQPAQEFVGVGRKRDRRGAGQGEMARDARLDGGNDLAEHDAPFVAREPGRVAPGRLLPRECNVRPVVMAVGREVDALRRGLAEAREMTRPVAHHTAP